MPSGRGVGNCFGVVALRGRGSEWLLLSLLPLHGSRFSRLSREEGDYLTDLSYGVKQQRTL